MNNLENETMKSDDNKKEKIKVRSVEIVVHGTREKPYYEIEYLCIDDNELHIGYSSYNLSIVFQWLEECFEKVDIDESGIDKNIIPSLIIDKEKKIREAYTILRIHPYKPKTEYEKNEIIKIQRKNNLICDGLVGPTTARVLGYDDNDILLLAEMQQNEYSTQFNSFYNIRNMMKRIFTKRNK